MIIISLEKAIYVIQNFNTKIKAYIMTLRMSTSLSDDLLIAFWVLVLTIKLSYENIIS